MFEQTILMINLHENVYKGTTLKQAKDSEVINLNTYWKSSSMSEIKQQEFWMLSLKLSSLYTIYYR